MKVKQLAIASAAVITLVAVVIPNQAEARWRGYGVGWRAPVAAGAVVGGLALGAAIASRPYYGGYGYGYASEPYYGGYAYGPYYGGVGPSDYEYNSAYTYSPGYRYNNYYSSPYRNWTEF